MKKIFMFLAVIGLMAFSAQYAQLLRTRQQQNRLQPSR